MSNKNRKDKKMSFLSIWLCIVGIIYLAYTAYNSPISFIIIITLFGFIYIRSK